MLGERIDSDITKATNCARLERMILALGREMASHNRDRQVARLELASIIRSGAIISSNPAAAVLIKRCERKINALKNDYGTLRPNELLIIDGADMAYWRI